MNAMLPKPRRIERDPEFLSIRERMPETLMKRMEALALEAGSPDFAFPLGKMKMRGDFGKDSNPRYEVCKWYFGLHYEYHKIIGSKGISAQSLEMGSKSESADPDTEAGQRLSRKENRIIREYRSARLAALSAGVEPFGYFIAVVIEEQEPDWRLKDGVIKVADALRRHRNLSRRKSQREKGY